MMSKTAPKLTSAHLVLLCISIGLATFLDVLDLSITNVALPEITGSLGESPFNGAWIISSYALGAAIMLPLSGYLSHRFGEVKVFLSSIFLFVLFSAFCGFAPNFTILVCFRILQGVCAGPLIPLSQSLLLANFPESKKGLAISFWSMIFIAGPIFGPLLGGIITDTIGWRWIFYINLPIGILCFIMNVLLLKHHKTEIIKKPIDIIGLILLIVGVASLQLFLDQGNNSGWFQSSLLTALFVVSLCIIALFIIWTLTAKHPIVDLNLYKIRNYLLMTIISLLVYSSLYGAIITYPLWLETQMGYTAFITGLALMPSALCILLIAPLSGLLVNKVDLRIHMTLGCLFFILAAYTASLYNTEASFTSLLPPRILLGIGIGLLITPITLLAVSDVEKSKLPNAMSLFGFFRTLGTAIGSSVGVAIFEMREKVNYHFLRDSVTSTNPKMDSTMATLKEAGMPHEASLSWIYNQTIKQSYTLGLNDFFVFLITVCIVMGIIIWLSKPVASVSGKVQLE